MLATDLDILFEDESFTGLRGPLATKHDAVNVKHIADAVIRELFGEGTDVEQAKRLVNGYQKPDGTTKKGLRQVIQERNERLNNIGIPRSDGLRFGANSDRFKKAMQKNETEFRKVLNQTTVEGESIIDRFQETGHLFDANTITPPSKHCLLYTSPSPRDS